MLFTREQITAMFRLAKDIFLKNIIALDLETEALETLLRFCKVLSTRNKYLFKIIVPMVKKQEYKMFHIKTLSTRASDGMIYKINSAERYTGISEYDFFTFKNNLKMCNGFSKFTICGYPVAFNKISTNDTCAKNLIQNDTKNCVFEPFPMRF